MKCQKCGQEVSVNNRFCPQCGSKLEPYFFWDIKVEFNSETMEKSEIVQGEKIVLESEAMVEELKKAESRIISLYSSMNINDVDSIRKIRDQIQEISRKYNIASTIVEELDYRSRKAAGAVEEKMRTEKSDSNKRSEDARGIFVEGSYERLKTMVERNKKRSSMEFMIIFIASVILLFWEIKGLLRTLMPNIGNKWAMFGSLLDLLLCICIDAIIAYLIWMIMKPLIRKRTEDISKECFRLITVNNMQALYEAVEALKIRNVFWDEHGNLCTDGIFKGYVLKVENQKLVACTSKNLEETLEINMIITSLLKQLDYRAPVNAYEKIQGNKSLMGMDRKIKSIIIVSVVLLMGGVLVKHCWKYVDMVQNSCPKALSDSGISYKEAFDRYFSDRKWKYFKSKDQEDVVEFNGKGIYDGKESDVEIQFILTEESENTYYIELGATMIDGEILENYEEVTYLADIFDQYENREQK